MSKEEFNELLKGFDYIERLEPQIRKEFRLYIEKIQKDKDRLEKENNNLKRQSFYGSVTFTKCPKCGEEYSINYCRVVYELEMKNKEYKETINDALEFIKNSVKDDWSIVETSVIWNLESILKEVK